MKVLLPAFIVTAVLVKLLQRRLPRIAYQLVAATVLLFPVAATFYAIWRLWNEWISWPELALFLGFYLASVIGITVGFHRLLTHRSFETSGGVKAVLLIFGSMANHGRCIDWAAHHLKHHAHSDRDGDPHSPRDGFFHAYMGWIITGSRAEREHYCRRLLDDRLVRVIDRTWALWVALGLAIPYLAAGWLGLLWGGLVRIALGNQVAFAVNSIGHMLGSRPFVTKDESRNVWLLAPLTFGDSWHNNHHAFPSMAVHGMSWWQFDPAGLLIRLLARVRLVWDVKSPPPQVVERRRRKVAYT